MIMGAFVLRVLANFTARILFALLRKLITRKQTHAENEKVALPRPKEIQATFTVVITMQ